MQIPFRSTLWKPPGLVRLNRSHPLAEGLVYASAFNEGCGVPRNLVLPDAPTIPNGLAWAPSARGETALFTRGSSNYVNAGSQYGMSGTSALSIFAVAQHNNLLGVSAETYVCSRIGSNGGFVFFSDSAVGSAPNRSFRLNFTLGGVLQYADSALITGGDGNFVSVGATWQTNNASGLKYYSKGALTDTITTVGHSMSGGENIAIGADVVFTRNYLNANLAAIYIWNSRVLLPEDFANLDRDPYQLLDFEDDYLFAMLAGAAAGGTTFNQSALASSAAIASLKRQTGKPLASSSAAIASLSRQTGKPLQATSSALATLTSVKVKLLSLLASSAAIASLSRQTGKPLKASSASLAAVSRQTAKSLAASSATIASLLKSTTKTAFQAATTPVATLTALKVKLLSLLASTTPVASLSRQVGKPLAASSTAVASIKRGLAKSISAAVTPIAALNRSTTRTLLASTTPVASLSRSIGKALQAIASALASLTSVRSGAPPVIPDPRYTVYGTLTGYIAI